MHAWHLNTLSFTNLEMQQRISLRQGVCVQLTLRPDPRIGFTDILSHGIGSYGEADKEHRGVWELLPDVSHSLVDIS